jgi:hypothetical protein
VVFKIEGENDWLTGGSSGPSAGEALDRPGNDGVGLGRTTAHTSASRWSSHSEMESGSQNQPYR